MPRNADDRPMISNEVVEDLLRGVRMVSNDDPLTLCAGCGYPSDYKAMFHPASLVHCMIERLAARLYPDHGYEAAVEQVAGLIIRGHGQTFDARLWEARAIRSTQDEILTSIVAYFRIAPGSKATLHKLGSNHYSLAVENWPLQGSAITGAFIVFIELLGGSQLVTTLEQTAFESYLLTMRWQSAEATDRSVLLASEQGQGEHKPSVKELTYTC